MKSKIIIQKPRFQKYKSKIKSKIQINQFYNSNQSYQNLYNSNQSYQNSQNMNDRAIRIIRSSVIIRFAIFDCLTRFVLDK